MSGPIVIKTSRSLQTAAVMAEEKIDLTPVEVERAGQRIKLTLISLGAEEGLTIFQAADLFHVGISAIQKHLNRHQITYGLIVRKPLQVLKSAKVIPLNAPRVIFIPRKGLRELARVIHTDAALAAYHSVFDDLEEYQKLKSVHETLKSQLAEAELKASEALFRNSQLCEQLCKLIADLDSARSEREQIERQIRAKKSRKGKQMLITDLTYRTNMFGERDIFLTQKQLPLEDMTPSERKAWNGQHAVKCFAGLGRSIEDHYGNCNIQDQSLKIAALRARDSAESLHEAICPKDAQVETTC